MSQRFEGKSLEEALQHAAETLKVERYELTYHVVLEKRGFLGGVKRVVIEAEINPSAATVAPAEPPASHLPAAGERPAGGRGRGRGEAGAGATHERGPGRGPQRGPDHGVAGQPAAGAGRERGGRGRGGRGREGGPRSTAGERAASRGRAGGGRERGRGGRTGEGLAWLHDEQPVAESAVREPVVVPEQGPESEGAAAVHAWVDEVIRLAKIDVVARTEETDERLTITMYGHDADLLTAEHGELLDAIQVLANKALGGRKIEKDIELDCQAFKGKRVEDLEQRAREIADRVRRGGKEELLPAMTPIERRIVHVALQDDAEVTTESRGDGFYKRVAIIRRPSVASS